MKQILSLKTRELVIIGLFAGAAKASSIMIALMGGGMNPLTLILKNAVCAALWLILLIKIEKTGTLTLAYTISTLLGLLLMGQSILVIPALIVCCVFAEIVIFVLAGIMPRIWAAAIGIAVCELLSKALSLGVGIIGMREQPMLIVPITIIVTIGYIGVLIGLAGGSKMVKELRHAGLI